MNIKAVLYYLGKINLILLFFSIINILYCVYFDYKLNLLSYFITFSISCIFYFSSQIIYTPRIDVCGQGKWEHTFHHKFKFDHKTGFWTRDYYNIIKPYQSHQFPVRTNEWICRILSDILLFWRNSGLKKGAFDYVPELFRL